MKCKGQPGERMWASSDPRIRRFEREVSEQERQARYAAAFVGPKGEHYARQEQVGYGPDSPDHLCSLEEQERRQNRVVFWKPKGAWSALWSGIFSAGMYSSDPTIARIGEIETIKRQVIPAYQAQRAEDQARAAAQREQDRAEREEEMRLFARVLIEEIDASRSHA